MEVIAKVVVSLHHLQMGLTECSETLAHTIQTPGNHPKERSQNSEQGESVKSMKLIVKYY